MMMQAGDIPDYPKDLNLLAWPNTSQVAYWKKQIPAWVLESCALFPTHQLRLLHFVGRYPQMLELLDHSPILAWRLVAQKMAESDLVALLSDKRTKLVEELGWPGKQETVQFLRNLRLRLVTQDVVDSVETCLLDETRLKNLQALPRINSMALSLAARFPDLIGSRLHRSLAQLPCRPMQCQAMIAQLEDVYRAADYLNLPESERARIGQARYLVDVEKIYQAWCFSGPENAVLSLSDKPLRLTSLAQWTALSQMQQHCWLTDWPGDDSEHEGSVNKRLDDVSLDNVSLDSVNVEDKTLSEVERAPESSLNRPVFLVAFVCEQTTVAALIESDPQEFKILRARQGENQLPTSEQLSRIHLWLAGQLPGLDA